MKITYLNDLNEYRDDECIAAIGHFDGFHLGHLQLINKTKEISKKLGIKSVIITMEPDPLNFITKQEIPCLTSMSQRIEICKKLNIDEMVILRVDEEFLGLSAEEFIFKYLGYLKINTLVCGFDYRFACNASGNIETLKNSKLFNTIVIDEYMVENRKVSTTLVKELLSIGDIASANALLYNKFKIKGEVVYGDQRGRTLGFPTANLKMEVLYTPLKKGVYVGYAIIDNKHYLSMINVGTIPTFKDSDMLTIEGYILDYNNNLYGQVIEYEFVEFIRDEKKFSGKDALIEQLNKDKQYLYDYQSKSSK